MIGTPHGAGTFSAKAGSCELATFVGSAAEEIQQQSVDPLGLFVLDPV
jgi:hypothetical protein